MSLKDNAFSDNLVPLDGYLSDMELAMERMQEQISQMQEQALQMKEEIARVKKVLKEAEDTSISVGYIENELKEIPAKEAWDIFQKLNALLMENPVWHKYVIDISSMLKDRLRQQDLNQSRMLTYMEKMASSQKTQIIIFPQAGSTSNIGCLIDSPQFKLNDKGDKK